MADRGEPGNKMYENKGLVYSLLNNRGEKTGAPIKASTIYTKPTLKNLEERFIKNKETRRPYRESLKKSIESVIGDPKINNRGAFSNALKDLGIDVVFRKNAERVYGVTFIDHRSQVVFNGSDLDKQYSAARLLSRLGQEQIAITKAKDVNADAAEQAFNSIDYRQGVVAAIAQFYDKGMRIKTSLDESGNNFYVGKEQSTVGSYASMSKKMDTYFRVNGVTPNIIDRINGYINDNLKTGNPVVFLSPTFLSFLQILLREQQMDHAYAVRPTKRRKRKR